MLNKIKIISYIIISIFVITIFSFTNILYLKLNNLDFNKSEPTLKGCSKIYENNIKYRKLSLGGNYSGAAIEDQQGNDHLYMWRRDSNNTPIEINKNGWDSYGNQIKIKNLSFGGYAHFGAVIEDQQGNDHLYMWGNNKYGQLGNNSTVSSHPPIEINKDGWDSYGNQIKITNLSLGKNHSGAVIEDQQGNDHLYMWGDNTDYYGADNHGQLGNGSGEDSHIPIEINKNGWGSYGDQIKITNLSLGHYNHSGAVIEDRQGNDHLYMWGYNKEGQLGNHSIHNSVVPIEINENGWGSYGDQIKITNLSLGDYHSGAIIEDQQGNTHLYMWGYNNVGQLGNNTINDSHNSIEINKNGWDSYGDQIKITNLFLGASHSGAVIEDQQGNDHLYMWGSNHYGELGDNTTNNSHIPIEINKNGWDSYGDQIKITNLSLGEDHSGAVIEDQQGNDHLYMWGYNYYGQLGNNTTNDSHFPIEIIIAETPKGDITINEPKFLADGEAKFIVNISNLEGTTKIKENQITISGNNITTQTFNLNKEDENNYSFIIKNLQSKTEYNLTATYTLITDDLLLNITSTKTLNFTTPESPKGDIIINEPQFLVNGDAKFIVNVSNLEGTTKIKENQITISGNNITTQTLVLNKEDENNYSFTIKNLQSKTEYNLTVTYTLITDTSLDSIESEMTKNLYFIFPEFPKGDITINEPQLLNKGEAKFIVNISNLDGTTKIKENKIIISGNNITTQTLVLNKEDENNYSFIIKNLQSNTEYNLTAMFTLITDDLLNISSTKTLNFATPKQLSSINLKIDSLDYYSINLSWNKLTESEDIMYSIMVYDNKNNEIKRIETSENFITIDNLNYNKKYIFKIYAYDVNEIFWSSEKINLNFKTKDLYPWSNYLILILSIFILIFISMLIVLIVYKKKLKFS